MRTTAHVEFLDNVMNSGNYKAGIVKGSGGKFPFVIKIKIIDTKKKFSVTMLHYCSFYV